MKKETHHLIYLGLLTLFVVFLPTSKYLTSLVQILLLIHWLLRPALLIRIKRIARLPALWAVFLLFAGHLAGLIYSENFSFALHDLKIKLPLLVLPLVIATSEELKAKELKWVLLFFVAAVFASSLVSLSALMGWIDKNLTDFRDASLFISHIRFALLVDLSVYILTFYALRRSTPPWQRLVLFGFAGYFLGFLVVSKSLTGIVVALVAGMILALRWILRHSGLMAKWFALVAVLTVPLLVSAYISSKFDDFYTVKDDLEHLGSQTVNGNPYWHDSTNLDRENGFFVGLYWCEPELKKAWNERSDIPYDTPDLKGQNIKYTLIRYLTSMGARKDSVAVSRLSDEDINLIEQGYANVNYLRKNRFHNRIYETIWQLDVYRRGGNPSGHSVTQRLEYLKTGWAIFLDQPFLGVGTGDVQDAFQQKYEELDSPLAPQWRLRAHNQWLTFAIALGIPGFLLMLFAFIFPGIYQKKFNHYLFLLFMIVAVVSMFNEDTLETQAGVALVAFFYPLLLFSIPDERKIH